MSGDDCHHNSKNSSHDDSSHGAESRLRVALIQADLIWADPQANRARLEQLMDQQPEADLIILPETFTTGFLGDEGIDAEPMNGPTLAWMNQQAAHRSAAICGSFVVEEGGERRNRMVFVDDNTKSKIDEHTDLSTSCLGYYDKGHLFGPGGEGDRYRAGSDRTVIEWRDWRIDLQICYDLRFPVWCRNGLNQDGQDVRPRFDFQLFVANWPSARVDHWQSLLKARAIENQSFVIGLNRVGVDGNQIAHPGSSMAFSPAGHCLIELNDKESTALVTLDKNELTTYRKNLPFLTDADVFNLSD